MFAEVQRRCEKLVILVFLLFLGGFFMAAWLLPDSSFSQEENRVLQQLPAFSWQQVYEGSWTGKWEKYVADQFPGRNYWISGKSLLQKAFGQKDINGVYLGKNDYLLPKSEQIDLEKLVLNLQAIRTFAENHPDYGVKMALIPTATAVLQDYLPRYAEPLDEEAVMAQVAQGLSEQVPFLSLYSALSEQKEEEIYYRIDHHWTTLGAYYGYRALGELLGYQPYDLSYFTREQVSEAFYGTLYSKGNFSFVLPDRVEIFYPGDEAKQAVQVEVADDGTVYDSLYDWGKLQEKDKYAVFLGGNHAYVKIKTNAGTGKKLHLIKDSYAHSLVPFLSLHYDEIYLYDLRYFRYPFADYIKGGAQEDVLILYNLASYLREGTIKDLQYR